MSMNNKQDDLNVGLFELARLGQLIDEKTKCRFLGESLSKSRRNRMFGRGVPFVKHGRQVRFDPRDVIAFIQANRHSLQEKGAS